MMLVVRRALLVLMLGTGSALAPAAGAQAAAPIWSMWEAAHSGMCMTVSGSSTANKAELVQQPCVGSTAQLFTLEPVGTEGAYLIRNYRSQKCLDVKDYSIANHAIVQQYTCHAETNQRWFRASVTSLPGYYHFVNRGSWLCLSVQYGSVLNNAKLRQYECGGVVTTHQAWR